MVAMHRFRSIPYLFFVLFVASSCDGHRDEKVVRTEPIVERINYDSLVSRACLVDPKWVNEPAEKGRLMEDSSIQFCYTLYEMNYLPPKDFLSKEYIYRQDGSLFMSYSVVFDVPIGVMCTYDEEGRLLRKDSWEGDYAHCAVNPSVLVNFLEREGWFDRKTGASFVGRCDTFPLDGNFTHEVFDKVIVDFFPASEVQEAPMWLVLFHGMEKVPPRFIDKYLSGVAKGPSGKPLKLDNVVYEINAETGRCSVRWEYDRSPDDKRS